MAQMIGFDYANIALLDPETEKVLTGDKGLTDGGVFRLDANSSLGVISASISGLAPQTSKIFGSNQNTDVSGKGTGNVQCTLSANDFPAKIQNQLLGMKQENGAWYMSKDTKPPYAVVQLVSQDRRGNAVYIGLTKGTFSPENRNLQTNTEQEQRATDSLQFNGLNRNSDSKAYIEGWNGDFEFDLNEFNTDLFPGGVVDNSTPNNKTTKVDITTTADELAVEADVDLKNKNIQNFDKKWSYGGSDLGVTYTSTKTTIKAWSPTSTKMQLILYRNTDPNSDISQVIEMKRGTTKDLDNYSNNTVGLYSIDINGDFANTAYAFRVTHTSGEVIDTQDPYCKAVTRGGNRSVIVDMSSTNPDGFTTKYDGRANFMSDAIVGELHVRDFTNASSSGVDEDKRGKFLGMIQEGTKNPMSGLSTGFDYLKESGLNYIQIMPFFDSNSIDSNPQTFSWGYDPKNYNALQSEYSSNPLDPTASIKEFKSVIKKFHDNNIGIVMDVVFNHMFSAENSSFEKLVPGYYFRKDEKGNLSNGSNCGNDFASEHAMNRSFITQSVDYWSSEYGIDGFRFDIMSDLDVDTMNIIADHHSQDKTLLYGEGWSVSTSLDDDKKTTLANANKTPNIGFFNASFRDAVSGSGFDNDNPGFVSGRISGHNYEDIISKSLIGGQGLDGFSSTSASQVVNYVECHDDATLTDKLWHLNNGDDEPIHGKREALANALTILSHGISFVQVGQDFWRNKQGNTNSYNLSDDVNNLNWDYLKWHADTVQTQRDLINLKKKYGSFRSSAFSFINDTTKVDNKINGSGVISYTLKSWEGKFIVVFNASGSDLKIGKDMPADSRLTNTYADVYFSFAEKLASNNDISTSDNGNAISIPNLTYAVYRFQG